MPVASSSALNAEQTEESSRVAIEISSSVLVVSDNKPGGHTHLPHDRGGLSPQDPNVGIVRYEYDFPENIVMTDKTRHANVNVTRVSR